MTTSKETDWMDLPHLRKLVNEINALPVAERFTLVKGLIPGLVREMSDQQFESFVNSVRLKGERFQEAQAHPGEGRLSRERPGERELEGR